VLTVNALLDDAPWLFRLAKALLSSLSVCAGVILALRAGHSRRIHEAEKAHEERKAERAAIRAKKNRRVVQAGTGEVTPFLLPVQMLGNGHGKPKVESIR